jgi:acetyl esterase/lipase
VILYLPGGGFIFPIRPFHWHFLAWLHHETQLDIYVGQYPLTPKYNVDDVMHWIDVAIARIQLTHPGTHVILMGDSAGGNIALAYTQHKPHTIRQVIAIAPVVNFCITQEDVAEVAKHDLVIATPAIYEICAWYRAYHRPDEALISPINGDYAGVDVLLISGTRDITNPETRRLAHMYAGIHYIEVEGGPHCFPLFAFPESRHARLTIVSFLLGHPLTSPTSEHASTKPIKLV